MSRPILPSPSAFHQPLGGPSAGPPSGPPSGPSKPAYAKRGKITIVACVPCRKRKTKCDGKRPACSQCQTREGKCMYDMTDEQRRLTFLRDNVEHLVEEKSVLESVIWYIQTGSDEDVSEIVRRLRAGTDAYTVAQHIQAGRALAQVGRSEGPASTPSSGGGYPQNPRMRAGQPYEQLVRTIATSPSLEAEEIVRRIRTQEEPTTILQTANSGSLLQPLSSGELGDTPDIEAGYSGREQTFGLVKATATSQPEELIRGGGMETTTTLANQPWTSVTNDYDFIEHLLSLYFSWQHSFFQNFPEKLFREDMAAGRTKYCSRLLVNAICATGCLLSNRPEARRDPDNVQTAGLDFFEEAVRLLNEIRHSSIPTTAALYLLCQIEGNRGQLSSLWMYSGRSSRMALDINLHLRSDRLPAEKLASAAQQEENARLHTFWGCFIGDQVTSFTLGRLPAIPTNAITVDLPPIDKELDDEEWIAYGISRPRKLGARATTFHEVAALSKIVNSTLQMFFAPSKVISGAILLDEYDKYLSWYRKLPSIVVSADDAPPHVLSLHMYYHAAVLLLFRPFLKAKLTKSDVAPRVVCRQAANTISDLFAQHRCLYDLVGINTFQVHCLLTACTIHIINLPSLQSTGYLTDACNIFQALVTRNEWATSSLNIIQGLVQKWNLILPLEAEQALYHDGGIPPSNFDFGDDGDDPPDPGSSGSSESGRGGAGSSLQSHPSGSSYPQDPSQAELFRPEKRAHLLNPSSQVMQKRQRLAPRETREQPVNYLFAPFPNQPAPLLGPIHTSTSAETELIDEMNKVAQGFDGLDFEGDAWFDPFMGYAGEGPGGFPQG